ncbi:MAG: hypothetical protein Q9183_000734 [Haloplaca sp. 2 TL-2023]
MTTKGGPAQAIDIKETVASTTRCTSSTVSALKALLFPGPLKDVAASKTVAATGRTTHTARPLRGGRVKTLKQPEATVVDSPDNKEPLINDAARHRLSTEIVNIVLKALTDAIKPQCPKQAPPQDSPKDARSLKKKSRPQTPLQPICGNTVLLQKTQPQTPQKSDSISGTNVAPGLLAQAECASLALAALRASNAAPALRESTSSLQLENATATLISKLLGLGLFDPALRELRTLRNSLVAASADSREASRLQDDRVVGKDSVHGLLRVPCISTPGPLLSMIVTFQLQVVRLIAAKSNPHQSRAAFKHLQLETPYSPANLILAQQDSLDLQSSKRIAGQLENLSRMILSMCTQTAVIGTRSKPVDPVAVFQLQILALEIRSLWWKVAAHEGNFLKDLVEPFGRYLGAFRRQYTDPTEEGYNAAKVFFTKLTSPTEGIQNLSTKSVVVTESWRLIVYEMFEIARRLAKPKEMKEWLGTYAELPTDVGASACHKCKNNCMQAIMCIQLPDDPQNEAEQAVALNHAELAIQCDLNGTSEELDELLLAIIKLRRIVATIIHKSIVLMEKHKESSQGGLIQECFSMCLTGVRFLCRYVGSKPTHNRDHQSVRRFEQRLDQASAVARSFIESVVSVAKFSRGNGENQWARIEAGLQDCLKIANIMPDSFHTIVDNQAPGNSISGVYTSISDAYWLRYRYLKQNDSDLQRSLRVLQACVSATEPRPLLEKLAAQTPTRLEQLAREYETAHDFSGALQCWEKAIQMHVEAKTIHEAATATAIQPLARLLAKDTEFASLGRVLTAYPRTTTSLGPKMTPGQMFYDNHKMDPAQRGMILEHQLAALCNQIHGCPDAARIKAAVAEIVGALLRIYSEQVFPIRRLRVVDAVLWFQIAHTDVVNPDLTKESANERTSTVSVGPDSPDIGLQPTQDYLEASRDTALAMRLECPKLKRQKLDSALARWHQLVENCSDPVALETRIGDVNTLVLRLELLAEFLDVYGLGSQRLSALQLCSTIREKAHPVQHEALALGLAQLGLQYLQLGHSHPAGLNLHKAHKLISEATRSDEAAADIHVKYATYFFAIGSIRKCEEHLTLARVIYESSRKHGRGVLFHDGTRLLRLLADVCWLYSDLAAKNGNLPKALAFSYESLDFVQRAWASVGKQRPRARPDAIDANGRSEVRDLTESMSIVSIQDSGKASTINVKTPIYWRLIPQLHRAFFQLAQLYDNAGLFIESKYYLERSQQVAEAASAPGFMVRSLSQLADLLTRSEYYAEADNKLQMAAKYLDVFEGNEFFAAFQIVFAWYHLARRQDKAAEQACNLAESTLRRLEIPDVSGGTASEHFNVDALQEQISELTVAETATKPSIRKPRVPVKRSTARMAPSRAAARAADSKSPKAPTLSAVLNRCRRETLRQRAILSLRKGNLDQASSLLAQGSQGSCTRYETVAFATLSAEIFIQRGLNLISGDPVFCVLPESTVCLPSIVAITTADQLDKLKRSPTASKQKTAKAMRVVGAGKKTQTSPTKGDSSLCDAFRQARLDAQRAYQGTSTVCSTGSLHHLTKIITETLLRISALSLPSPQEASIPGPKSLLLLDDAARSISAQRGRFGVRSGSRVSTSQKPGLLNWPDCNPDNEAVPSVFEYTPTPGALQEEDLDMLPTTWQVLTISLSRDRHEILLSRLRPGQSPFVLSLPLDRHSSRDPDDESFGFGQAKTELQEIIALADYTTHEKQSASCKKGRLDWWEGRAALDARLKELLDNISNIWFGGFQGLFSQRSIPPDLLSRFQTSLNLTLDNHLPSRQTLGKKQQSRQTTFDPRVMELFVALGDPAHFSDMEEPLMDLLYFVIDILQFNGERNAYDEIDFDAMVIETIDALRQYHEAAKRHDRQSLIQHTVLVLDKELHCFPWESLPCLDGHAITRLASLSCLRDRIIQQQQRADLMEPDKDRECRRIVDRRNGAFVLNPVGDLGATQSKFEHPLSNLSGWEGLTASEPNEEQLKAYLQERDVFLYFGHGSGQQYIRPKTIQRLDKCAVALLMGCSSGKLTEAGEFEPYGTPMSYMHAGCPAVLATLWNVTDKDIDRFSDVVLQKWGLFQSEAPLNGSPRKKTVQSKGKSKACVPSRSPSPPDGASVSLDQAVAQGRSSCNFRYLNGAAPVVYGIPVFLS